PFELTAEARAKTRESYKQILAYIPDDQELNVLLLLLTYVNSMSHQALDHWQAATHYEVAHYLHMDYYAKSNLELAESVGTMKGTVDVLAFLNETETAMDYE